MKRSIRLATVVAAVLCMATGVGTAYAASVRVTWQHPGDVDRYRLFIAQPDAQDPLLLEVVLRDPTVVGDGIYSARVSGVHPDRPAFLLMTAVSWQGWASEPSNVLEVGPDAFCTAFDVDNDGVVTVLDALAVARRAIGLDGPREEDGVTITDALEILRVATVFGCT